MLRNGNQDTRRGGGVVVRREMQAWVQAQQRSSMGMTAHSHWTASAAEEKTAAGVGRDHCQPLSLAGFREDGPRQRHFEWQWLVNLPAERPLLPFGLVRNAPQRLRSPLAAPKTPTGPLISPFAPLVMSCLLPCPIPTELPQLCHHLA